MESRPADNSAGETQAVPAANHSLPPPPSPSVSRSGAFGNGEVLLGRFRVERLIGHGGMGEVYEAQDLELGRVALKTVRADLATAEMLRLFRQEVQIARKVTGPHVCRIHEMFTLPPVAGKPAIAFLTMEYLEGESLSARLHAGPIPPKEAQQIALDLCSGLESIHRAGILHRDLKSRNVMLVRRESGQSAAVLTDFGLALSLASEEARGRDGGAQGVSGTPETMAPEQFAGDALTPAADIYALGVLLYQMATGTLPFHAHTPLEAAVSRAKRPALQSVAHGWREVIQRCLEIDPAQRYQSANEVAAALRRTTNRVRLATHDTAMLAKRFRVALTLAAIAAVSVTAFLGTRFMSLHVPPKDAARWYGKGVDALRAGTYVKAIHALEFAVALDPRFAMAHARLAEAWSDLDFDGDADHEMLVASGSAQEQRMSKRDRQTLVAVQATLTRDYPTAEARYRELADSASDEEKASALVDLGRLQEKAGEMDAALATYKSAAAHAPDQPAPFVHIGILESRALHKAQAQAAFAQAEKFYNADDNREGLAEIEYQQGYLANERSDAKTALAHLNNALIQARAIPSQGETGNHAEVQLQIRVLTQLSAAESTAGDQKQAAVFANQAIDLANANGLPAWAADGLVRLADSYLESNDDTLKPKAEPALQQALQLAGASRQRRVEAEANVTMANLCQDDPPRAISYARPAFEYYKQYKFGEGTLKSAILLARAQTALGNLDAALRSSQELLQLAQSTQNKAYEALVQDLVASVWLAKEDYPRALEMYQAALTNGGDALRPYEAEGCAWALAGLGRFKEADAMLPFITRQASAADVRGQMLLNQLKYPAAAAEIDSAMAGKARADWSPGTLLVAAVAHAHLHKFADAQADLAAFKAATAPAKAYLDLASAEVAQQQGNLDESRRRSQSALAYFRPAGTKDSGLRAALLAEESSSISSVRPTDSSELADFVLDTLRQIQQSWPAEDSASFAARPDIASLLRAQKVKRNGG